MIMLIIVPFNHVLQSYLHWISSQQNVACLDFKLKRF